MDYSEYRAGADTMQHLKIHGANSSLDTSWERQHVPEKFAIYAKNLCKSYSKNHVLHNFCMGVKKGSIYGLVGASGCGKSTLILCIVGCAKWKSGDLLIFGEKPKFTSDFGVTRNELGYMPQDTALNGKLSFSEVVQFYGRLYGMSSTEIMERRSFLTNFLNLPEDSKLIEDFSGGQKRRASLALAMLHSPELLVLDEPTVGLDPLLRIKLWQYFEEITSTLGTTVLITTHYVEEARNSATVGVMRDGRLLAEDTPSNLLELYNGDSLERVVLEMCKQQATKSASHLDESLRSENSVYSKAYGGFDCDISFQLNTIEETEVGKCREVSTLAKKCHRNWLYDSIRRVYAYTIVLLLSYLRFPTFLGLVFLMPTFHGGLLFLVYSSTLGDTHFGVVNHELTNWKSQCLSSNQSFKTCDFSTPLSCKYLSQLTTSSTMILNQYKKEDDALADVHRGTSLGYLVFPANYSQNSLDLVAANLFPTNESIEGSRIRLRIDYAEQLSALMITKHLYTVYLESVQRTLGSCGISGNKAALPLKFRPPVYGSNDDDYSSFAMPGLISCSLFALVCALTGVKIISDKKEGTLIRARVAGLAATDVLISHLITQTLLYVVSLFIFTSVMLLATKFTIHGSLWTCMALCVGTVLYSAALGVLLGILLDNEAFLLIFTIAVGYMFILYGDAFYPKENMSKFCQIISPYLPTSLPTIALRSVVARGHGLMQSHVWKGFAVIATWMLGICITCVLVCKRFL